jgi:hypothetical protein
MLFGKITTHVNDGSFCVRQLDFSTPHTATPIWYIRKSRYFWLKSGEVTIDAWRLTKEGMLRNQFSSYTRIGSSHLKDQVKGMYVDAGCLIRLWSPTEGSVFELATQQYAEDTHAIAESCDVREVPIYVFGNKELPEPDKRHVLSEDEFKRWWQLGWPVEWNVRWDCGLPVVAEDFKFPEETK